jgi:predicted RNA-binding Zn-ribbon protein involved in translation (DUF1610 family)
MSNSLSLDWDYEPQCPDCGSDMVRSVRWNEGDTVHIDCNDCEFKDHVPIETLQ